ncbi:MAG: TetR/AcrR family transcriptional regulator [Alphaproteobacteria bacterium]|nr:TetR/AcrR family transcriptional regulator [Alphaproteobacteria bacterium]
MPKETFFNLPEDKRERIVQLAIEEFSERPYRQASLSRIVSRAGIAKGSIYQYFDNKADLYGWLLTEETPRRKLAWFAEKAPPEGKDFFSLLEAQLHAGLRFGLANPRLARLGDMVLEPTNDPEVREIHERLQQAGQEMMRAVVAAAVARGELRAELDPELGADLLMGGLRELLNRAMYRKLGVSTYAYMSDPDRADRLSACDLDQMIREVVQLLRLGLAGEERP